jgi:hypothetical protein
MDFGDDDDDYFSATSCVFPGQCLMPGIHLPEECHTADMMEQLMIDEEEIAKRGGL